MHINRNGLFYRDYLILIVVTCILIVAACTKTDAPVPVNNPAPSFSSVSPNSITAGSAGFTLTINGANFVSGSIIKWNGVALATTYISVTQISAIVSSSTITSAGPVVITVFSPAPGGGTSSAGTFTISTANAAVPTLTGIVPNTIAAGTANFTLTVTGTYFVPSSTIKWNGVALTTTYVSATQLTALVPRNTIIAAGSVAVTVFSPAPGGGTSSASTFTITAAALPALTSLSPNSITVGTGDFNLIAQGVNFANGATLQWNGSALATTFVSATQLLAVVPAAKVSNVGTANINVLSSSPASTSNALTFTINAATASVKKVLFDASHGETSGNADWVLDADNGTPQRFPTPLQSTITANTPETYWTGGISSFGIALVKHGYAVETLPVGTAISYGNSANVQDLSNYNVFVVDEPNKVFTAAEKLAILNFVNAGGGLFMVADHTISDRDNDGWDSPMIWNDLMTINTQKANPFGFSIDLKTYSGTSSNVLTNGSSPVLSGSQGTVTKLDLAGGTTATLNTAANGNVKGLIWYSNSTQNASNVICLTSTYGTGRVFFVGDSSPLDDGTGALGENLFVDWPTFSHQSLFMNATLWLAKEQ